MAGPSRRGRPAAAEGFSQGEQVWVTRSVRRNGPHGEGSPLFDLALACTVMTGLPYVNKQFLLRIVMSSIETNETYALQPALKAIRPFLANGVVQACVFGIAFVQ